VHLGFTCKSLSQDQARKSTLIQKIIDIKFYENASEFNTFPYYYFPGPFLCSYDDFENLLFETMCKLKFSDIKIVYSDSSPKGVWIEQNGVQKWIPKFRDVILIPDSISYSNYIPSNLKIKLIDNLTNYIIDGWTYFKEKIYGVWDCNFFNLFHSIENFLKKAFLKEDDIVIRRKILDNVKHVEDITQNYKLETFIESLLQNPFLSSEIKEFIEVGKFLAAYDPKVLRLYIENKMETVFDTSSIYLSVYDEVMVLTPSELEQIRKLCLVAGLGMDYYNQLQRAITFRSIRSQTERSQTEA
jgi:hypothetical protein